MIVTIKNLKDWEREDISNICLEYGLKCLRPAIDRLSVHFAGTPPETVIDFLKELPTDITTNGLVIRSSTNKCCVDFEILPPLECFRTFMYEMAKEYSMVSVTISGFGISDACNVYKILLMRGLM